MGHRDTPHFSLPPSGLYGPMLLENRVGELQTSPSPLYHLDNRLPRRLSPTLQRGLCHHKGCGVAGRRESPGAYRMHVDEPACLLTRLLEPLKTEPQIHLIRPLTALQALECRDRGRGAIVPERKEESQCLLVMMRSTPTTLSPPSVSIVGVTQ